ncbi:MAG: hypothetical protein RLY20_100 [Verrucomicrobiota bacterium]|jgi:uncharacterized protein Yka (UPF0111/DUF47 family)
MFSFQQLFGKGDKFQALLEEAASEANASAKHVIQLISNPANKSSLDDLVLARRKEKKIAEQISEELVKTFVTGLEREDIEALSLSLKKIPKTAEKFAERWLLAAPHLKDVNFTKQGEMMVKATEVVLSMVKQLRDMDHLEKAKEMNDKLQYLEGEADRLMLELLKELYSGKYEALSAIVIRDLYELMEKVIDRCRDAGNVVMHIVLKNS